MRFSVYFDSILNEKWLFSSRNNDISRTHARGHAPQQVKFRKNVQFGVYVYICVYFDQILP